MSWRERKQFVVALAFAAALLAAPAGAATRQHSVKASPSGVLSQLVAWLQSLTPVVGFGKAGSSIDPDGMRTKEGSSVDPNGASMKAGSSIDPNGAKPDAGSYIDPNGTS